MLWFVFQCELYHWADVLDLFDGVLEKACKKETEKSWTLACDLPCNLEVRHCDFILRGKWPILYN